MYLDTRAKFNIGPSISPKLESKDTTPRAGKANVGGGLRVDIGER